MRLRAKVLEGDKSTSVLVPLATVMAFTGEHGGRVLNDAMTEDDFVDWEPWVAWHASTHRLGETRGFDEWVAAVDWCGIENAPDELDPSGGEVVSTEPRSPESSSASPARGKSSSDSTTRSSKRSGSK